MQCENVERYTGRVAPRFLLVNTALRQKRPCKRRHSKVDANDGRAPDTKAALASGPSKIAKRWQDRSPRASASTRGALSPRALSFTSQDSVRSDNWFGTSTPQSVVPLSPFAAPAPIAAAGQARNTRETPLASPSMQQVAPPHIACSVVPSLGSATSSQPLFSTTPLSLEPVAAAAHTRNTRGTTMGNPSMEPSQAASSGVPTQGSRASSQPLFSTPAHSLLASPQPISVTPSSSFNLFSSPMSHVGTLTTHCDSTNSASEALHADPPSQANINAPGSQPTAAHAVEELIQDASQPLSQAVPSLVKHVPWRVGDVLAVHARARGSVWYCVVESFEDQDGPAHVLFLSQKKGTTAFCKEGTSDDIERHKVVRYGVPAVCFCRRDAEQLCACATFLIAESEVEQCQAVARSERPPKEKAEKKDKTS